jgi:phenylalanine-4-hydroxylase
MSKDAPPPSAPVSSATDDRAQLVKLDRDHPGFRDRAYRDRRDAIARLALEHREGQPPPEVAYTESEQSVWQTIWEHLTPLHDRFACDAWREGAARLDVSRTRVPQLRALNEQIAPLTGFRLVPVAGLVAPGVFLRHLARGEFLATQYMRHASAPLYTPEPDVVHEVVGHALSLAHEGFAALNRAFGEAACRARDAGEDEALVRVYWWTLEFGALEDAGRLEVYGAGLLSSFGELGRFAAGAPRRPFDLDAMARTPFDPTDYQAQFFVAPPFEEMAREVLAWLKARL